MNRDPQNVLIAARLEEVAALLEHQSASLFRVEAYRRAAEVVRGSTVRLPRYCGPVASRRSSGCRRSG